MNIKTYLTCCVDSSAVFVEEMVDLAVEIDYKELLTHVTPEELDKRFPEYEGAGDLTLESDYAVSYYRSIFAGQYCVYVVHSAIEHIFV